MGISQLNMDERIFHIKTLDGLQMEASTKNIRSLGDINLEKFEVNLSSGYDLANKNEIVEIEQLEKPEKSNTYKGMWQDQNSDDPGLWLLRLDGLYVGKSYMDFPLNSKSKF